MFKKILEQIKKAVNPVFFKVLDAGIAIGIFLFCVLAVLTIIKLMLWILFVL